MIRLDQTADQLSDLLDESLWIQLPGICRMEITPSTIAREYVILTAAFKIP